MTLRSDSSALAESIMDSLAPAHRKWHGACMGACP